MKMDEIGLKRRLTHIWESTRRQTHSDGTHQRAGHDEQVRVWVVHPNTNLLDKWENNQSSDCMRYKSGDHEN